MTRDGQDVSSWTQFKEVRMFGGAEPHVPMAMIPLEMMRDFVIVFLNNMDEKTPQEAVKTLRRDLKNIEEEMGDDLTMDDVIDLMQHAVIGHRAIQEMKNYFKIVEVDKEFEIGL